MVQRIAILYEACPDFPNQFSLSMTEGTSCAVLGDSVIHFKVGGNNMFASDYAMGVMTFTPLRFKTCHLFGTSSPIFLPLNSPNLKKPFVVEARGNTRRESPKIQNRRIRKKFNGTAVKPRLSVFCSDKQLYAMLVDDEKKKCLFYCSTLQQSIRENLTCTTVEAAERVGEELVKACIDLNIEEISSYDRNGLARGARMEAFEIAISRHGFFSR